MIFVLATILIEFICYILNKIVSKLLAFEINVVKDISKPTALFSK